MSEAHRNEWRQQTRRASSRVLLKRAKASMKFSSAFMSSGERVRSLRLVNRLFCVGHACNLNCKTQVLSDHLHVAFNLCFLLINSL